MFPRFFFAMALGIAIPGLAFSYQVRCNKAQTMCEVETKRLTIGDRVGIFAEGNILVAVGTVNDFVDRYRKVKIDRRFGPILADHSARRIDDDKAAAPSEHFRIFRKGGSEVILGSVGLYSLAIGENLSAYSFEGVYETLWQNKLYWAFRGQFATGSGEATAILSGFSVTENISFWSLAGTAGLSYYLLRQSKVSIRGEAGLGFNYLNGSVAGGGDFGEFIENRASNGVGIWLNFHGSAIYNYSDETKPFVFLSYGKLHATSAMTFGAGLSFRLAD